MTFRRLGARSFFEVAVFFFLLLKVASTGASPRTRLGARSVYSDGVVFLSKWPAHWAEELDPTTIIIIIIIITIRIMNITITVTITTTVTYHYHPG